MRKTKQHMEHSRSGNMEGPSGGIKSVNRALNVLEALFEAPNPLTLTEISQRVGLHVSTTYRLLFTLGVRGFVKQDGETGRYRVGLQAFRIGNSFSQGIDLRSRIRPTLEELASRSGETANLVIVDGIEAVYIDHVPSTKVARLLTQVGQRVPLHCTAVGKVLLGGVAERIGKLPSGIRLGRFTAKTITTKAALEREIASVRTRGFAIDREEHEVGVGCVAAPVRGVSGDVVAAVGISGPSGRVLASLSSLVGLILQSADKASRDLGASMRILPTKDSAVHAEFTKTKRMKETSFR